ncbi:MAG: PBP1A family penicillin-binding protein [Paenibacillaceae bacterium]|nr:PBP1A family penicillin-binding protein [Paenibacillaceae bacterium]
MPEQHRKPAAPSRLLRRLRKLASLFASLSVITLAGLFLLLLYWRSQALPAATVAQTSMLYDARGEVIDAMYEGQNRSVVPLADVSPWLVKAVLAIEDHRFYEHYGIDPQGVARAVMTDLRTMSMEQGASTITQQLARNLYLDHERTWSRKIKEAVYTMRLELQLSKNQILEQYLNQIYFGHATYGIQAASQLFLHKDAKDLTLAESALLAGIPKGPKFYSPFLNMANTKDRQKLILDAMAKFGDITQEEADEAYAEPIDIVPQQQKQAAIAPYFRDYVRQVATEQLGIDEALFDSGGIKVYTSLDLDMQKAAEAAVAQELPDSGELQAALVAIDPRTGYIKAMVGGRNYADNQFNRAFATTRQPGSSFKPIVYLTALENGFTPLTQFRSEPTTFTYDDGRQTYTPSNYGGLYENGPIDMRTAIAKSDNIYAVNTIVGVGADKVIEGARKLGISSPLSPLPSLALGTYPVSPFEMAAAFSVIANGGEKSEPTAILRIEDASGKVLYEANPAHEVVFDPAYAYVLTNLMQSVFEEGGTGYRVADTLKRPVAGKTGTTNTDAWMVGFTPELATAVWVGYDKARSISAVESHLAAPIFASFTENALAAVPPKLFAIPNGVVTAYIDPASGKLANTACSDGSRLETFVAGTEPTAYCADTGGDGDEGGSGKGSRGSGSWWSDLKRWWRD